MNGKLARAIRRVGDKTKTASLDDVLRVKRNLERQREIQFNQPKLATPRKRKPSAGHQPTWPHTANQRKQSRPMIVERPLRKFAERLLMTNPRDKNGARHLSEMDVERIVLARTFPKHRLDALALG